MSEPELNPYKDTIDLPQTDFPMRGNGAQREPEFQAKWAQLDIYKQIYEQLKATKAELFVLHDGPPYLSSDRIHIGTALNKILKDIIIKYKTQKGFNSPYIPGYDSHGLPIETAVVKEIKGGRNAVSLLELRELCKAFALKNLKGQETNFKRLGILGDWEHPYITLNPDFEAAQIRVFAEMVSKSYIYRGLKPVYWSYGAETALADAEVEYNEEHESTSVYVSFAIDPSSTKIETLQDAKIVIWTTTPWTLVANQAICLNSNLDYQLYSAKQEDRDLGKILIASARAEEFSKASKTQLKALGSPFKGSELKALRAWHPLYDRPSPIIFGEHVNTEAGTGCVHTAPGHGIEDFHVGQAYGLNILCPVDSKGYYTNEAAPINGISLEGIHVLEKRKDKDSGNEIIIEALKQRGALIYSHKIKHSYPYCWRSKTPLLFRATRQWFASLDGFRDAALRAIATVEWIPPKGRKRIEAMVAERGDWCISRQRAWGLPIPVFYDKSRLDSEGNPSPILDLALMEHIAQIFAKEGSNAWYSRSISELLPPNSKYKSENLIKETDTMDVWFDSGSSHRAVVAQRPELSPDGHFRVADLYLEGSDQHRGWFQSSLLTSVATNGYAPYKSVLTHGFVLDEKGRKMSKSLANVIDPQTVISEYGADILRLWVASVDYSMDIKVGPTMFKQLSDIYRNLRNTSRYMLGNLFDFYPETESVPYDALWDLDRLVLHKSQKLIQELSEYFDNYQFFKYYQVLQNFCSVELSAFYFDIIKDRLYTHGSRSRSRKAAQTVLYKLLSIITRLFVPVLPHLAEDIYQHYPSQLKQVEAKCNFHKADLDSILASKWPEVQSQYLNEELSSKWTEILELREMSNKAIEDLRKQGLLGKSLEASISIHSKDIERLQLASLKQELKAVFIVSEINLDDSDSSTLVKAKVFEGQKCQRCWKLFKAAEMLGNICQSCSEALK